MRNVVSFVLLVLMWAAAFSALALTAMGHLLFALAMVVVTLFLGVAV